MSEPSLFEQSYGPPTARSGRWFRRGNTILLELRDGRERNEEGELKTPGETTLSSKDYLAWMQRSLNRILGNRLVTDGSDSLPYRSLVRQFQGKHGLPETGQVDSPTQNEVMKANERIRDYMAWVHRALESDSVFSDPPLTSPASSGSFKSTGLRLGIEAFQKRQGLKKDGFVGAKTEVMLIQICRCLPPGHVVQDSPIIKILGSIGLNLSPGEMYTLSSGKPVSLASRPDEFNRALANAKARFDGGTTQAAFRKRRPRPKYCAKCKGACFKIANRTCLCFGNGFFISICRLFGLPKPFP